MMRILNAVFSKRIMWVLCFESAGTLTARIASGRDILQVGQHSKVTCGSFLGYFKWDFPYFISHRLKFYNISQNRLSCYLDEANIDVLDVFQLRSHFIWRSRDCFVLTGEHWLVETIVAMIWWSPSYSLQAARQVEFLVGRKPMGPNTDSLEEAVAILQHHDGVSYTK